MLLVNVDVGDRVELDPCIDWRPFRGRSGVVTKLGRERIHVRIDETNMVVAREPADWRTHEGQLVAATGEWRVKTRELPLQDIGPRVIQVRVFRPDTGVWRSQNVAVPGDAIYAHTTAVQTVIRSATGGGVAKPVSLTRVDATRCRGTVTVSAPHGMFAHINPEDIEVHVFGSCFNEYPWWLDFTQIETGDTWVYEVLIDDGDDYVTPFSYRIGPGDILAAMFLIWRGRVEELYSTHPLRAKCRQFLAGDTDGCDLDAADGDIIMQLACMGAVPFG